jgi:integrase
MRPPKQLTDKAIAALPTPATGRLIRVAPNLYIQQQPTGSQSWLFRYAFNANPRIVDSDGKLTRKRAGKGEPRSMGLGTTALVPIKKARELSEEYLRLLLDGIEPREHREAERDKERRKANPAPVNTFAKAAESYIASHAVEWGKRHEAQWRTHLSTHASALSGLDVAAIDTDAVMRVLEPIWVETSETAKRLRGKIEAVLDYGKTRGWRDGENPARWRGHLANLLPKLNDTEHHAALPYADIPTFYQRLIGFAGIAGQCVQFLILTACRSGEARGATLAEIDWQAATWTIPASRMKTGKKTGEPHVVPLSDAAMDVLREAAKRGTDGRNDGLLFPGRYRGTALSDVALSDVLKRLDVTATIHGMRATFRTWAADKTSYPSEIAEACLAHKVGSALVRSYQRGTFMERRRALMGEWGTYVASAVANVHPFRAKRA